MEDPTYTTSALEVLNKEKITFLRRACLYEAGWPVSELARLQVRSCLPGHNFVNISLRLYACRAGSPCRHLGYPLPGSRLRACLYEAGWPVSELARLQVRSCLLGHNFVNISLRLYACRAGSPCRDLGYRLPGSRLRACLYEAV